MVPLCPDPVLLIAAANDSYYGSTIVLLAYTVTVLSGVFGRDANPASLPEFTS